MAADELSATFTPSAPLLPYTLYNIYYTNQIKDIAGNGLFNSATSQFTTAFGAADAAGPSVVSVCPQNGAVDVPVNGNILIRFSEAIAGTSLNAQTIILSKGGQPVDAALTLEQNGTVVRVKSANLVNLLPNTLYEMTVTTGVMDVAGNPLSVQFNSPFTAGSSSDTVRPAIVSRTPVSGSQGVSQLPAVSATFSEPINPLTVSFGLTGGGISGGIPGSVSVSADMKTVTYTPANILPGNQTYTINIGTLEDLAGNLVSGSNSSFTTGYASGTDLNALPNGASSGANPSRLFADGLTTTTVTISNISRNGALVPNGTKIAVTVDRVYRLDSFGGSIPGGTVSAADPRFRIFTTLGGSVTFTYRSPDLAILPTSSATVYIQTAQVDAAEAPMQLISTGTITLVRGASASVGVNPVNLLTASGSSSRVTVTVYDNQGNPVPAGHRVGITTAPVYTSNSLGGSISGGSPAPDPRFAVYTTITGGLIEFDYTPPVLAAGQSGTAYIQAAELDNADNVLGSLGSGTINLSGSTGSTAPQPVIRTISPVSGQSGVGFNAPIVVSFSQSLYPATVTATTFSVSSNTTINGTRILSAGPGGPNSVVTFTPTVPFAPNSSIYVWVGTGIKSASGSPLLSGASFSFSTGTAPDGTPPFVVQANPVDGIGGVSTNSVVLAYFSEIINAASVTPQSFTLSTGGATVPGRISVSGNVAVFTPDQLLSPATNYTLNINQAITDTAGNAMAVPYASTFTTASGIDNFQPWVVAISPASNAVGVPATSAITVTFSEPLNPATINGSSFSLSGPGGKVSGNHALTNGNTMMTFTPAQPLFAGGQYMISLSSSIADIAGNRIPGNINSYFTVALAPGTANLPTAATVTMNPGSLFANGQISTTGTISNIKIGSTLAPNGTVVAVTTQPAFTSNSVGGMITGSSIGNSADPRFMLFSTFGGQVTVSYTPSDLTGKGSGTVGTATIQVASVDMDNRPVSLIGSGTVSLYGLGNATVTAIPTSLAANGAATSSLAVTIRDSQGNLAPDGTRVGITADPIFSQTSVGGVILGGADSPADGRVKIFTTTGGQITATYQAASTTGTAVIQAVTINPDGWPTALLGTASINVSP